MSLLLRPGRLPDEGPCGYRYRLAAANMISVRHLNMLENDGALDGGGPFDPDAVVGPEDGGFSPWVRRWARFCPNCLADRQTWALNWEILFADACPQCGSWLVDSCSGCGARTTWNREQLLRCDCGQSLSAERGRDAPLSVVKLSGALASVAMGQAPADLPPLSGLDVEQCARVVRLLGTYGSSGGRNVPQKVPNVDRLDVSWTITSYAAEVLCRWPDGMTALLRQLREGSRDEDSGRLGKAFGGFYSALYKAFGAPEFSFLRRAFESYVAEHWTGPVARRNRRLDSSVLDDVAWIPANHARRALEVSPRRLNQLIDQGLLRGDRRRSAGGREFLVVLKADVTRLAPTVNEGVSLLAAAERLGLKRQRLGELLPIICPEAAKIGAVGCPWSIPVAWVERWEGLLRNLPEVVERVEGLVSLGHLPRYWPWTDEQVGRLLVDILDGRFAPVGIAPGLDGLSALLLGLDQTRQWFAARHTVQADEMTVPEVAVRLEVKQEVAYALVRTGLIASASRRVGRRAEQRVALTALNEFGRRYVFCRDIARTLARSPKAVASFLATEGVAPASGPEIDSCRQLVFARADVDACLIRHGIGGADL